MSSPENDGPSTEAHLSSAYRKLDIRTRAGIEKRVVVDFFPAYDDDGGLLLALTPR